MEQTDPIDRAQRRAAHLRERAMDKPIGSNGRRKDIAAASSLEAHAARLTTERQQQTTERVRALGVWTP